MKVSAYLLVRKWSTCCEMAVKRALMCWREWVLTKELQKIVDFLQNSLTFLRHSLGRTAQVTGTQPLTNSSALSPPFARLNASNTSWSSSQMPMSLTEQSSASEGCLWILQTMEEPSQLSSYSDEFSQEASEGWPAVNALAMKLEQCLYSLSTSSFAYSSITLHFSSSLRYDRCATTSICLPESPETRGSLLARRAHSRQSMQRTSRDWLRQSSMMATLLELKQFLRQTVYLPGCLQAQSLLVRLLAMQPQKRCWSGKTAKVLPLGTPSSQCERTKRQFQSRNIPFPQGLRASRSALPWQRPLRQSMIWLASNGSSPSLVFWQALMVTILSINFYYISTITNTLLPSAGQGICVTSRQVARRGCLCGKTKVDYW